MPRTLVFDHDPGTEGQIRTALSGYTARGRHDFVFARSDDEAVELIRSSPEPDIAVIDIDSPDSVGLKLFRALGETRIRIPRIALTTGDDIATVRRAMNEGAADFLTKPVNVEDLLQTIDRVYTTCEARRRAWRSEADLAALKREIDIAGELQQKVLPQAFPRTGGLDLFGRMRPAREMGGDFYDAFELEDGRIAMVVADVVGKGISAAFFMAVASTVLRGAAAHAGGPGACLAAANRQILRRQIPGMVVSAFCAVLDPRSWTLTCANAGHPLPYVVRGRDRIEPIACAAGVVLGVEEASDYPDSTTNIAGGELVLCYTDGLTEARDPGREEFGDGRVRAFLAEHAGFGSEMIVRGLERRVREHVGDGTPFDDLTLLAVRKGAAD
ncbi:MAG: SpoIIE family protein phosphatase [Acetobacterales bacterium]